MGWLEGRTALVTGGGSGIGRAVVDRYVEEGATVGVLDLDGSRLAAVEDDHGDDVVCVQGDVTDAAVNEAAVAETTDAFGGLDVFVGNAGIFDNNLRLDEASAAEIEAAFRELFDVNVLGYLLGAKAALPALLASEGCMIFTASYASFHPATGGVLYTPAKHAVAGVVRQLAYELAPKVRVNGVAPGYSPTNLAGVASLDQGESPAVPEEVDERYPLPIPDAGDYAGYYVLLASEENARASTGTVLMADSGLSIRGPDEPAGGTHL